MKKIIIIFLVFFAFAANAQTNPLENAPKKSNMVVIEKEGNALDFLIDYGKHLQDFGFTVENINKDFLSLSTDFKEYKHSGVAVIKLNVHAKQKNNIAILVIRGKIEVSSLYGTVPFEACKCGMVGDARKNGFREIGYTLENFNYSKIEIFKK